MESTRYRGLKMEFTRNTWLVLIIAAFIVGLIIRGCLPPPGVQTLPQPTPVIEAKIPGTCAVPSGGAACHFVSDDKDNPVDITLQVPQQKELKPGQSLTFTSIKRDRAFRPEDGRDAPRDKREMIYRNFMGLVVTIANTETKIAHFDPAITIIAKYFPVDLRSVREDPRYKDDPTIGNDAYAAPYLSLFLHDGYAWRRLPMLVGSRDSNAMTLTSFIGSFELDGDIGDGGD